MFDTNAQHSLDDPVISIGVLAQRVGLSVSTIRKYENEGLIIAHRTDSGHRLFSMDDIERVRNIHHMIRDLGFNIEGIRRMQSLLPCWDLHPCDAKTRKNCPAFNENTRPCWTIKGLDCSPQGNECRRCIVYRFGSLCTQDIKRLLHDHDNCRDAGEAMLGLLQRLKDARQEDDLQ